ncbi:MAG: Na-translocating system protein MpsC family protein [Solirubrobacteraceae bacterium]
MATETTAAEHPPRGALCSAISTAIVRLMREYTGRGPMKARTTIRDNVVLVMLEQTLTKGEQVLVGKGRGENVLVLRHEFQEAMREESSDKVAELTGRGVTAMMSANHLAPDLAAEIYILDGPPAHREATPTDGSQQQTDSLPPRRTSESDDGRAPV